MKPTAEELARAVRKAAMYYSGGCGSAWLAVSEMCAQILDSPPQPTTGIAAEIRAATTPAEVEALLDGLPALATGAPVPVAFSSRRAGVFPHASSSWQRPVGSSLGGSAARRCGSGTGPPPSPRPVRPNQTGMT